MKIFIWHGEGVMTDWTNGQIVAIAPDLETAYAIIIKRPEFRFYSTESLPEPEVLDIGDQPNLEPRAWVTPGGG